LLLKKLQTRNQIAKPNENCDPEPTGARAKITSPPQ